MTENRTNEVSFGVKTIPLTQGYFAIVDDEDYEKVSSINWCVQKDDRHNTVYAKNGKNGLLMHRYILGLKKRESRVDHVDGNGLNNTRKNMRKCSNSENLCNRVGPVVAKSGHRGVYWSERRARWVATIMKDYKKYWLGRFVNLDDAIAARKAGEEKYHGNFKAS